VFEIVDTDKSKLLTREEFLVTFQGIALMPDQEQQKKALLRMTMRSLSQSDATAAAAMGQRWHRKWQREQAALRIQFLWRQWKERPGARKDCSMGGSNSAVAANGAVTEQKHLKSKGPSRTLPAGSITL